MKIGQYSKNWIPSDDEEAPGDWTDLISSLPSSPEVAEFVDRLNQESDVPIAVHTPPGSPPLEASIGETLALLDVACTSGATGGKPKAVATSSHPSSEPI